jgi:hypothetical protein
MFNVRRCLWTRERLPHSLITLFAFRVAEGISDVSRQDFCLKLVPNPFVGCRSTNQALLSSENKLDRPGGLDGDPDAAYRES